MATLRTLPPWVVLDKLVHLDGDDGSSCATLELECVRSEAIGVNVADSVVGSFTLMARLVDPPGLSFLCLRSSEQVTQALGPVQFVQLESAGEGVLVMTISFNCSFSHGYYLVYDSINLSLVLSPFPSKKVISHTNLLLPFRGGDKTYGLVNMIMCNVFGREDTKGETGWKQKYKELLSLWLPSSSTPKPSSHPTLRWWHYLEMSSSQTIPCCSLEQPSTSTLPWEFKEPIYPDVMPSPFEIGFNIDFVFSFKGISFWADQFRGLLYCKQSDLLSDHHVQFNFLPLPEGCHHYRDDADMEELPNIYRAVGCSGESVKFVSITYTEDLADRKVTTWVLMPDTVLWKEHSQLCVRDIWEQQEFKRAGIPASAAPMVPILSPHEDDVIYLMMVDFCNMDTIVHMLRLNIHEKLLISSTRLPSWQHIQVLQFLGSDFSKHLPLAPEKLKRKGKKSRWS